MASTQARSAAQVSNGAAENSEAVATATEQLTASIKEISAQAHQTSSLVTGAMQITATTDQDVVKLGEATDRIGSVLDLIRQIAQQTNLLALNATIESARAGEAGKGFAVVASEVKNLATQTARATDEIASQIEGVQLSTQSAIEAIREISGKVTEINGLTGAIAAAVEEQTAATQEIAHNVSAATDRSRQAAQNVSAVLSAADKTSDEVDHVENVSEQLGAITKDIQSKLDQFVQGLASNQRTAAPSRSAA
jgi:methyl-accepting chemotaxis protein